MTSGPMVPSERLDIDVEVLVDGAWHPGWLEHRRQRDGVWEAWVRYTTGVGETRIGWFGYDVLREGSGCHSS